MIYVKLLTIFQTSQNGDINLIGNSNQSEILSTENTDGLVRSQCEVQASDFNGSPKQYREEEQSMPSLLSSPTIYMPRPGFPQVYLHNINYNYIYHNHYNYLNYEFV